MKTIATILNLMLLALFLLLVTQKGRPADPAAWLFFSLMLLTPLSSLFVFFRARHRRPPLQSSAIQPEEEVPDMDEPAAEGYPDVYDLSEEKKKIERLIGK